MRVTRYYRCDFGHRWIVDGKRQGDPESPEEVLCQEGHEAITCQEKIPPDEVQILFRPETRVFDEPKGRYQVVLLDREDRELCASEKHYSWEDAVQLANLFRGKPAEQAMKWWSRRSP